MDSIDKELINRLQDGIPLCRSPFGAVAEDLGISAADVVARLRTLREHGMLSRFGPMYNIERSGGCFSLAAMKVPQARFEEVAAFVNAQEEIAHNYEREHDFNMWFVIAAEQPEQIDEVIQRIEQETGIKVYNMPKKEEFYVGLRFEL